MRTCLGFFAVRLRVKRLRIADQAALTNASAKVSRPIAEGLIREDGRMLYPINNGIPQLIPEEGIPL